MKVGNFDPYFIEAPDHLAEAYCFCSVSQEYDFRKWHPTTAIMGRDVPMIKAGYFGLYKEKAEPEVFWVVGFRFDP